MVSRMIKPSGHCACRCGTPTGPDAVWAPAHDAKAYGIAVRKLGGSAELLRAAGFAVGHDGEGLSVVVDT